MDLVFSVMVSINYEIDDDLHRRAKVAAAEQGVTLKVLVIEALRQAVEDHEQQNSRR